MRSADTATRDRRVYFAQRAYISDPSMLVVATVVSYCPPRAAILRDPGEVQWAQRRPTDPTLLATALLENELLGGAETAKRHFPAVYDDRREVPQQRPYVSDPSLLATALLEGALLGGAETAKRHFPAIYDDRREVPQQRPYVSDPAVLATALLEGPLLGGAETAKRNLPATHVDRREMPQQRLYISDPSFYPIPNATDPTTLAWGAGGTYWLLYNTAALDVDRREAPQQRRYVSDPGLLATALLENELLVGDGRHATWYARPWSPISTRVVGALDVQAEPLQLTADLLRRILTPATHADRRQAGQQPRRLADQSTPRAATVRATSSSAVTAGRTSAAAVMDRRTSAGAVTDRRTSTPGVEG